QLHLVETSAPLRAQQAAALQAARPIWHDALHEITPAPTLLIANEFLDCLPIRQFVRTPDGWRERLIGAQNDMLAFGLSPDPAPEGGLPRDAPQGAIIELAPGLPALIDGVARQLAPGRALIIDYGARGPGDTLQAVAAHRKVDPLYAPGEADLTAH